MQSSPRQQSHKERCYSQGEWAYHDRAFTSKIKRSEKAAIRARDKRNAKKEVAMTHDDLFDAAITLLIVFALLSTGCAHCQTFYRYDGGASARPYYRLDICRNRDGTTSTTLVCDSPNRLPNNQCR